jgi:hypothetical protein
MSKAVLFWLHLRGHHQQQCPRPSLWHQHKHWHHLGQCFVPQCWWHPVYMCQWCYLLCPTSICTDAIRTDAISTDCLQSDSCCTASICAAWEFPSLLGFWLHLWWLLPPSPALSTLPSSALLPSCAPPPYRCIDFFSVHLFCTTCKGTVKVWARKNQWQWHHWHVCNKQGVHKVAPKLSPNTLVHNASITRDKWCPFKSWYPLSKTWCVQQMLPYSLSKCLKVYITKIQVPKTHVSENCIMIYPNTMVESKNA